MSLANIRRLVAAHTGLDLTDDQVKLDALINDSIKDLYKKVDMQGCLFEQIFFYDPTTHQVAMPSYVKYIRGIREYTTGFQLQMHDMRPRYAMSGWAEQWQEYMLVFRDRFEAPVSKYTDSEGPLTFTVPAVLTEDVTFTIVGGNSNSTSISDKVTLTAGQTSVTAFKNFDCSLIRSITKDKVTEYDVTITDIDDVEISSISNESLRAAFRIVQCPDFKFRSSETYQYVEVLYKQRIADLVNAEDEFVVPEIFDDAFYWMAVARYYAKEEGRGELVQAAGQKALEIVMEVNRDVTAGVKKKILFAPNPIYGIFNGLRNNTYNTRWTMGGNLR